MPFPHQTTPHRTSAHRCSAALACVCHCVFPESECMCAAPRVPGPAALRVLLYSECECVVTRRPVQVGHQHRRQWMWMCDSECECVLTRSAASRAGGRPLRPHGRVEPPPAPRVWPSKLCGDDGSGPDLQLRGRARRPDMVIRREFLKSRWMAKGMNSNRR